MRLITFALVGVLALVGCATAHNYPPAILAGTPDVARFKVYTAIGVPESEADRVAATDFDAYRVKNGYAGFTIVERRWNQFPTYFEYTVKFTK